MEDRQFYITQQDIQAILNADKDDDMLQVCKRCAHYMISCDGSNATFCNRPEDD